jgi:parallel beta-helix repeat protein
MTYRNTPTSPSLTPSRGSWRLLATVLLLATPLGASIGVAPPARSLDRPVPLAQNSSNTTVIYVNSALGRDTPGAGESQGAPYRSITYALSQLNTPATIQLAPGTYSADTGETFPIVLPSGVTLRGDETTKGQTTLVVGGGDHISPSFARQSSTVIAKNGSTLRGVTLSNPRSRGTGLWIESSAPTIANNTFTNSLRDGIFITGSANPTVEGNVFIQNNGNGISIVRTATGIIRGNVFDQTGFGIAVGGDAAPRIEDNRITRNNDGIVVSGSAKPILRENTITNNVRDGIVAISNAAPNLGTAEDSGKNYIRDNGRYDLYNATSSNTIVAVGNDIDRDRISGAVDFVAVIVDRGFPDVVGHWAQPYIEALASKKIIAGFEDGTFRPNEPVTRAQFAAIINQAFSPTASQSCSAFSDVSSRFWGFNAILNACRGGFLRGYPNNEFRAQQQIPRVQVLVALVSGLDWRSNETGVLSVYQDSSAIPDWATTAIAGATAKGLVVNYPLRDRLNPNREATRAEVAAFVYQALVNAGEAEPISSPYLVRLP